MKTTAWRPHRVAIVDDDESEAIIIEEQLVDTGLETVLLDIDSMSVEDVVETVANEADAAVFDHWLSQGKRVGFTGAEAVSLLNQRRLPSILTTMFQVDAGVSIRRHRANIPVLLERSESKSGAAILDALTTCHQELIGVVSAERVTQRVPISVERVMEVEDEKVVDAIVAGWDLNETVRYPLSLMPTPWSEKEDPTGRIFFAWVNIGATSAEDLFFEKFEVPPAEEPKDLERILRS